MQQGQSGHASGLSCGEMTKTKLQPDVAANKDKNSAAAAAAATAARGSLTFVSALLELLVVGCLLDEVQDGDGQVRPRERVRLGVHSVFRHR